MILKNKVLSIIIMVVFLVSCSVILPQQKVNAAINYTKNTNDYINYALKGVMPNYTPSGMYLYININGDVYQIDATVLISAIVQAEMVGGASAGNPYAPDDNIKEALKAQAVAATSFIKYTNDKGGTVAWSQFADRSPNAKTVEIVQEVVGEYLTYNGSTAQAFFMASSGLHTQSSKYIWGKQDIVYLTGVECKYDEAVSTKTMSLDNVRNILNNKGFDTSSDPGTWFNITQTVDGGYIYKINICGVEKSGEYIYSLLSLKTSKATITYNANTQQFTIITKGYGHGVGMSQISAIGYSTKENMGYESILSLFYQNTKLDGKKLAQGMYGDVNGDGVINVNDVILVQNYILGRTTLTQEQLNKADVTKDGIVNISDVIKIQNYILGRTTID